MPEFANSNILVTGGAGFVGSNLVKRLLDLGVASIHIVDNLLSSERINIPDDRRVRFSEDSIANEALLGTLEDTYDYVFHLATYHGNQSSMHDPIADHDNNLITTLKLFERLKNFKRLKKVVYSGAGCAVAEKTYDEAHATPEDAPISLEMDSPYSISKIVGEFYAVYYFNRNALPTVRARFQNVYGPGEILGAGQWRGTPATVWRNVTPTFIYKALAGESLPLEGGGEASRDFIFVEDIVEGLVGCASKGKPGDVYNLASGRETSILQLAKTINDLTGNTAPLKILERRDWDHSGKRFGSTAKSARELGFTARTSFEEGLKATVTWTKQNISTIEACINKHSCHL
ncbi:MAG: NAD-dependent epimerase/dehydratase family protein [Desulfuromonadales bacterium]|nr:MAG: NAD-dependent epimerase/dehydratase family protein [Desulfuromonadales bacterium]